MSVAIPKAGLETVAPKARRKYRNALLRAVVFLTRGNDRTRGIDRRK